MVLALTFRVYTGSALVLRPLESTQASTATFLISYCGFIHVQEKFENEFIISRPRYGNIQFERHSRIRA